MYHILSVFVFTHYRNSYHCFPYAKAILASHKQRRLKKFSERSAIVQIQMPKVQSISVFRIEFDLGRGGPNYVR